MNKTYRIIWNKAKGIYQAVAENAKMIGKSKSAVTVVASAVGFLVSALSSSVFAATLPSSYNKLSGSTTIDGGVYTNDSDGRNIGLMNKGTNINIKDDLSLTWQMARKAPWAVMGISSLYGDSGSKGGNLVANGNVAVVYNTIADNDKEGGERHAVGSLWGSTFTFNKNLDIKMNLTPSPGNLDTQHYAIYAGSGPNQNDKLGKDTYSSTIVKGNLTIDMTMPKTGRHDNTMVGIRSVQNTSLRHGEYSSGSVVVEGKTSINMDGYGSQGIYISNGNSKVKVNDIDIVVKNGAFGASAIKLGKARDVASGKGIITINGVADINTENSDGSAIQMFSNGSEYNQSDDKSSSKIRSKVAALEIGGIDWDTSKAATGSIVSANNADWSNKEGSLILVGKSSQGVVTDGQGANLAFTGEKTNLKAAGNGYVLDVNGLGSSSSGGGSLSDWLSGLFGGSGGAASSPSDVTFKLSQGYMQGLIYTNNTTSKNSASSKTVVELANGATWRLKKNTSLADDKQISNMNSLSLTNSTLDGAFYGGKYTVKVHDILTKGSAADVTPKIGTANFTDSVINLSQNLYNATPTVSKLLDGENKPALSTADVLTIDANYNANESDSNIIYMDTEWNAGANYDGANSVSDKLVITGQATGKTTVVPVGKDGSLNVIYGTVNKIGPRIINTLPVIEVQGGSKRGTFVGKAKAGNSAIEVQLTSSSTYPYPEEANLVADQSNEQKYYYWTGIAGESDTPIVDKRVPGYVTTPKLMSDMGFTTLGTLHQRIGENQTIAWDNCGQCSLKPNKQTWGRVFGEHLNNQGKERFGYKTNIAGVQLGHNFLFENNTKTNAWYVTGAYLTLAHASNKFYDKYHAVNGSVSEDKQTGSGNASTINLGLTHTRYSENGSYLDLVGQLSFAKNKSKSNEKSAGSQNGYGISLSAEVGRPYALNKHGIHEAGWLIEPQAQLMYQLNHLGAANDEVRTVKALNYNQLRGRVGARLAYNAQAGKENYRTNTLYLTANILHDFIKSPTVSVGVDKLSEKYTSTWGDVGVGIQLPVRKAGYIYADVHYERSFAEGLRSGYSGNIGYKYSW